MIDIYLRNIINLISFWSCSQYLIRFPRNSFLPKNEVYFNCKANTYTHMKKCTLENNLRSYELGESFSFFCIQQLRTSMRFLFQPNRIFTSKSKDQAKKKNFLHILFLGGTIFENWSIWNISLKNLIDSNHSQKSIWNPKKWLWKGCITH